MVGPVEKCNYWQNLQVRTSGEEGKRERGEEGKRVRGEDGKRKEQSGSLFALSPSPPSPPVKSDSLTVQLRTDRITTLRRITPIELRSRVEPNDKVRFFGSERERRKSFTFLRTSASPVSLRI